MSKISPPFCLLPLLLLAITAELGAAAAGGSICQEGLGLCGTDCDARCKSRHDPEENPQGNCDHTVHLPLCYCLYSCGGTPPSRPGPPARKVCHDGLGFCSLRCGFDCCSAKCAGLHDNGEGHCDTNAGVSLCQCSYPC